MVLFYGVANEKGYFSLIDEVGLRKGKLTIQTDSPCSNVVSN
jgi:hypothetical protein